MRYLLLYMFLTLAVGCSASLSSAKGTPADLPQQSTPCFTLANEASPQIDWSAYARKVQEQVQANWHVPEAQMILGPKAWVAICFKVQKSGEITDITIKRPSGVPSYDKAATDALRLSSPLPALPAEVETPALAGVFRFFYKMASEGCGGA